MKSQALQRVTSLAIAIALVLVDVNATHAQRDFDAAPGPRPTATPIPTKKPLKQNTIKKSQPVPAAPAATQAGETTVKQATATKQATAPRIPSQAAENPANVGMKLSGSTASSEGVKTANAVTQAVAKEDINATSPKGSAIKQVGYEESTKGINADGQDYLKLEKKTRFQPSFPAMMTPPPIGNVPTVHGALIGLRPGEAAAERAIQYQMMITNLERENQELRQQQSLLQAKLKEREEQLLTAIREIQSARKEVGTARVDLDRLKVDVQSLREKARVSEKEHESLLRSMGPLLQQLLEGNDVSSLPPNPPE